MALPTPAHGACNELCDEREAHLIYVKNTFISVAKPLPSQPRRRSVSVPAGLKLATRDFMFDCMVKPRGTASLPKVASMGAVSTATTLNWADSDTSSDVESSAWSSEVLPVIEEKLDTGKGALPAVRPAASSRPNERVQVRLSDLIAPVATPRRPSLSTKAKKFVSTSAATTSLSRAQVDSIVASMQSEMSSTGLLAGISTTQTAAGWSVCARVHAHPLHASSLLARAKSALVKGCEQSASIYLLGYLGEPFADTASGFSATLCGMEDEEAACWDYYSKGACRRGCACRWTHPSYQATVSVSLIR